MRKTWHDNLWVLESMIHSNGPSYRTVKNCDPSPIDINRTRSTGLHLIHSEFLFYVFKHGNQMQPVYQLHFITYVGSDFKGQGAKNQTYFHFFHKSSNILGDNPPFFPRLSQVSRAFGQMGALSQQLLISSRRVTWLSSGISSATNPPRPCFR